MGGRRKMKRSKAPRFWKISRKRFRFITKPSPGPHPQGASIPLLVLIREYLGLVKTAREGKAVIKEGSILIDGVVRRDPAYPAGLMDVIEIPSIGKLYRLVPKDGSPLTPIEVPASERSLKICRVKRKLTIKGGRIQYGLHDGRTIVDGGLDLKPGDACLIEVPSQKVLKPLKMEKGSLALVITGSKAGSIGKIEELKRGTFTRPAMALVSFKEGTAELPSEALLPLGSDKPPLQLA
ncbi:MAG: 30S ribosomal protein S4e [Nitrososphaerota archaeon]